MACAVGAIAASQSVVHSGGPAILLRLSVFGFVLGGLGQGCDERGGLGGHGNSG